MIIRASPGILLLPQFHSLKKSHITAIKDAMEKQRIGWKLCDSTNVHKAQRCLRLGHGEGVRLKGSTTTTPADIPLWLGCEGFTVWGISDAQVRFNANITNVTK